MARQVFRRRCWAAAERDAMLRKGPNAACSEVAVHRSLAALRGMEALEKLGRRRKGLAGVFVYYSFSGEPSDTYETGSSVYWRKNK